MESAREPVHSVKVDEKQVAVRIELPELTKASDIQLNLAPQRLHLVAEKSRRAVPCPVRPSFGLTRAAAQVRAPVGPAVRRVRSAGPRRVRPALAEHIARCPIQ